MGETKYKTLAIAELSSLRLRQLREGERESERSEEDGVAEAAEAPRRQRAEVRQGEGVAGPQ